MGAQELWRPQWVRLLIIHMAVERMIVYTGLSITYLVQLLTHHLHLEVTVSSSVSRPLQQRLRQANSERLFTLAEPGAAIRLCLPREKRPFLGRNRSALNVLSNLILRLFSHFIPKWPYSGSFAVCFRVISEDGFCKISPSWPSPLMSATHGIFSERWRVLFPAHTYLRNPTSSFSMFSGIKTNF